jgi:hypothetical protein
MKRIGRVVLVGLAVISGAPRAGAESASLGLSDGTKFSFELVRSAGQARSPLGSAVHSGNGVGYRILIDSKAHRFFGYTVKATALPKGRFTLVLGPLAPDAIERLAKDFEGSHQEKLTGQSLAIEYPPPQEVAADEPLMLELMTNSTTGEKLSDVIRVSSDRNVPEPDALAFRDARLTVNGKRLSEWLGTFRRSVAGYGPVLHADTTGGMSGRFVWFSLAGRGRFVISTVSVAGYDFILADLHDNRVLTFSVGGDTYEMTSAAPIVQVPPVPDHLWVWNDVGFKPQGPFGIGAMPSLPGAGR